VIEWVDGADFIKNITNVQFFDFDS